MGDFFKNVLANLGKVVDLVVPVGVGNRTKIAAVVAAGLTLVCVFLPDACPMVAPGITGLSVAVPVFAAAGLVRK
jgi:hypothetical protein